MPEKLHKISKFSSKTLKSRLTVENFKKTLKTNVTTVENNLKYFPCTRMVVGDADVCPLPFTLTQ